MKSQNLILASSLLMSMVPSWTMAQKPTSERPNILIFLIDDAGYNDFGFMGSKEILTPHIDALSQEGVIFDDAHVAATVSSPSRACLLTGRYGQRFGYECNLEHAADGLALTEETLGDVFHDNGYRTAAIGKWHLGTMKGMHPNDRGFDLFYGMLAGHREYFYNEKGSDAPGSEQNLQLNGKKVKFDGYLTDVFTDKAIEYINQDSDKPFMMYLAYNAVHTPMQAAKEDMARFKGHPRQKLAAMSYALDRGVGRIVENLKASGKYDNTLIFFINDNGGATINTSNNFPLKGFKGNKFEGGHRVPCFIVWNGKIAGNRHFDGLSSSLDIFTTAMDAAGIKKSKNHLDGVSLLPYLQKNKKGEPHKSLYWRKMDTRAMRQGDYKLIMTAGIDTVLYNVRQQIDETVDLKKAEPKVFKKMVKAISRWEEKVCVDPLWQEESWRKITNDYHRRLMNNEIKTYRDLYKKKK